MPSMQRCENVHHWDATPMCIYMYIYMYESHAPHHTIHIYMYHFHRICLGVHTCWDSLVFAVPSCLSYWLCSGKLSYTSISVTMHILAGSQSRLKLTRLMVDGDFAFILARLPQQHVLWERTIRMLNGDVVLEKTWSISIWIVIVCLNYSVTRYICGRTQR